MKEEFIMIGGQAFHPVNILATGKWQLLEMRKHQCYILVHPNGRQAWFHVNDVIQVCVASGIKFTANPFNDLKLLAKAGLRPFHVDADFDPTSLAQITSS